MYIYIYMYIYVCIYIYICRSLPAPILGVFKSSNETGERCSKGFRAFFLEVSCATAEGLGLRVAFRILWVASGIKFRLRVKGFRV